MGQTYSLRNLYHALRKDTSFRAKNAFSEDISTVNELLFDSYATNDERVEQLSNWMQRYQPCLFGRVAFRHWLHFCILTDQDLLSESDQSIAEKIQRELLAWKRRSLQPDEHFSTPAFGFILLAASPRLASAAPDTNLQAFSHKLRELWGCRGTEEQSGNMHWETLYLRHPEGNRFVRFTFSIDFFACQGDGRWWHDHRSPGGILFTANSVGHMRKYREWYLGKIDQNDWVLQTAMLTIDKAASTKWGKATWLRILKGDGRPVAENITCPFTSKIELKAQLVDKDWTKYAGWLHTDHSIRPEFFHENAEPLPYITNKEYLEDFMYLYNKDVDDHLQFVQGEDVSPEEVIEHLGRAEDWRDVIHHQIGNIQVRSDDLLSTEDLENRKRVDALLERGRRWRLTSEEFGSLW